MRDLYDVVILFIQDNQEVRFPLPGNEDKLPARWRGLTREQLINRLYSNPSVKVFDVPGEVSTLFIGAFQGDIEVQIPPSVFEAKLTLFQYPTADSPALLETVYQAALEVWDNAVLMDYPYGEDDTPEYRIDELPMLRLQKALEAVQKGSFRDDHS